MSLFVKKLWSHARSAVTNVIDDINKFENVTGINNLLSFTMSIPDNLINHTTRTDLSVLNNNYTITAPTNQDINHTPTASEFLNAANTEYAITGTPDGMKPFLVNGKQLAIQDVASGMAAKVWVTSENQIVIAYQGTTGGDNLLLNPLMTVSQIASDVQVWNQSVSQGQKTALKFAQYAVHQAEAQGYTTNNIFVTGHSLGGIEASYVAQQTGLGGVAFESTGIPSSSTAHNGDNFVSIVTNGDPVGEYASDTAKGNAFVTSMAPGANNEFNHYGTVVTVGDSADSASMLNKISDWNKNSLKNVVDIASIIPDMVKYHLPGTQAADMNITLSPHSLTADMIVTQHGPVVSMGNDSISQLMTHALPVAKVG